jgi:membrane-associated protease RseP (regulator of RpoE activity)
MNDISRRPGRIWINILLFALTIGSVFFVGLTWSLSFIHSEDGASLSLRSGVLSDVRVIGLSFIYTVVLILILLGHELGHYLTCRRYRIDATLPYFVPAPGLIGTLGAFIKIKSPITRKNELFDVGAAGPISGFILALPALVIGLSLSKVVAAIPKGDALILGEPLLLKIVARFLFGNLPQGADILLHPVAFAGWVGLLVTAFNLFPLGQLDGGHLFFALLGRRSELMTRVLLGLFVIMGIIFWVGWFVWAVLILVLGLKHPNVSDDDLPLSTGRKWLGVLLLIIFVLSFIPDPVRGFNTFDLLRQLGIH